MIFIMALRIAVFVFATSVVLFPISIAYSVPVSPTNFSAVQKRLLEELKVEAEAGGLPSSEWTSIQNYDPDVCYEEECLEAALEIMRSANWREDPCGDGKWIEFVCRPQQEPYVNQGNKLKEKVEEQTMELLTGDAFANSSDFLLPEARLYYSACVRQGESDQQAINYILNVTRVYGGWPLLTHLEPANPFPWMTMVMEANRLQRFGYTSLFFNVSMILGDTDVHLDIGQTSFPYTLQSIEDYKMLVIEMSRTGKLEEPVNSTQVHLTLKFMSEFNERLIEAVSGSLEDHPKEVFTLSGLQNKKDAYLEERGISSWGVDWTHFFAGVLEGTGIQFSDAVPPTPPLISLALEPVMELIILVEESMRNGTEGRVAIVNALYLNLVSMLLKETTFLPRIYRTLWCSEEPGWRSDICLQRTKEIFGYSLGKSYLRAYYNENLTPSVTSLMGSIKEGYLDFLDLIGIGNLEWMDNSTRDSLHDKLNGSKLFVVGPDWIKEDGGLEKFYEGFPDIASAEGGYAEIYVAVNVWRLVKKRGWAHRVSMNMHDKKGFHIYDKDWNNYLGAADVGIIENEIHIDAGLLQKPLLAPKMPRFMEYGGLGFILAHEMSHMLDTESIGEQSLDSASLERYNKWVAQLANFYYSIPHHITDNMRPHVDPTNVTIEEDISDVLGVAASFHAYSRYLEALEKAGGKETVLPGLKSLSPQKLFFIKYGIMWCENVDVQTRFEEMEQSHSSGNRRATLPLLRSEQFRQSFGCGGGGENGNATENEVDVGDGPSRGVHSSHLFWA